MSLDDDVTHTFKTDLVFASWLAKMVKGADRSKSDFIRTCILLSADTIAAHPSLCNLVLFEHRKQ